MFRYTNHVRKKCFLQNGPFHKVTLSEDGACFLCAKPIPEEARRDWDALEKRFAAHLDHVRGTRPYEGPITVSGGKDSVYLVDLLKETYGMRLLGFIIDINHEYPETFENVKTIVWKLDLLYVAFRQEPEAMRRCYRFLLTEKALLQPDGGQVCTLCGRFLIHSVCAFARRTGIPLVFSGHDPDQTFLMGESIHNTPEQGVLIEFLAETPPEETDKALARWQESYGEPELSLSSDSIHVEGTELLSPFQYSPYRPEVMMRHVRERLQWSSIKRLSKTYIASGCRLVKLWTYMAYLNSINSYVDFEFCNQIRNGTPSANMVWRFYEQVEIDYEELAELIAELDMVGPMKVLLTPYGEKVEALLRLLP